MKSQSVSFPFVVVGLLLSLILTGCAHRESGWVRTDGSGPQISEGQFAPLYRKCAGSNSDKQCQWAYEDAAGEKVMVSELVAQLDDTLANTRESRTWPVIDGQQQLPYRFVILSVSPTIVVGYPAKADSSVRCNTGVSLGHCLPSARFAGNYALATQISAVPGLVWFSPEHGARLFKVPDHTNSVFFMINGQSAKMKRLGTKWQFSRKD